MICLEPRREFNLAEVGRYGYLAPLFPRVSREESAPSILARRLDVRAEEAQDRPQGPSRKEVRERGPRPGHSAPRGHSQTAGDGRAVSLASAAAAFAGTVSFGRALCIRAALRGGRLGRARPAD